MRLVLTGGLTARARSADCVSSSSARLVRPAAALPVPAAEQLVARRREQFERHSSCRSPSLPQVLRFQWSVDPALADRRGSPGRPASRYRRPGESGSPRQTQASPRSTPATPASGSGGAARRWTIGLAARDRVRLFHVKRGVPRAPMGAGSGLVGADRFDDSVEVV